MYLFLLGFNMLVWVWAYVVFHPYPILFSTAILAYTFGLRHAVDPDHIAAIDNISRKLIHEGKQPLAVGLYFSLGHSSVIIIASICLALFTAHLVQTKLQDWQVWSSLVCTLLSAGFLFVLACVNLVILNSTYRAFKALHVQQNEEGITSFNTFLPKGYMGHLFKKLFHFITHSWQMYFLGFLFGLSFDTATEIALLSITASETVHGLSLSSVLIFPAMFTAGMTLLDTTDGILMLQAYQWAFINPIKKLYYNMTITLISIFAAIMVGTLEVLGLMSTHFNLQGAFWRAIQVLNDHASYLGFGMILVFLCSWGIAASMKLGAKI